MQQKKGSPFNNNIRDPNTNYKWIYLKFIVSGKSYWSGRKTTVQNCSYLSKLTIEGDLSSIKLFEYTTGIQRQSKQTFYNYGQVFKNEDQLLREILKFFKDHPQILKIEQKIARSFWKIIRPIVPLVEKISHFGNQPIPQEIREKAQEQLNSLCPGENYLHQDLEKITQISGKIVKFNIAPLFDKLFENVRPGELNYLNKQVFKNYIAQKNINDPYQTPINHKSKYSTSRQSIAQKKVIIKQFKAYSSKQPQKQLSPFEKLKLLQKRVQILSKIYELIKKQEEKQQNSLSTSESSINAQEEMMSQFRKESIQLHIQPQIPLTPISNITPVIDNNLSSFFNFEMDIDRFILDSEFMDEKSEVGCGFKSTTNNLTQTCKATTFECRSRPEDQHNLLFLQQQSQFNFNSSQQKHQLQQLYEQIDNQQLSQFTF